MINYYQIASEYLCNRVGNAYAIVPESIKENENFYSFTWQSREYLETRNIGDMMIGQGYEFLHKKDLRFFGFGSGTSYEQALSEITEKIRLEARIRERKPDFELNKFFDLQIIRVHNKQALVDILLKHSLSYTQPETVGSRTFRIPKPYNRKLLNEHLQELPLVLSDVSTHILPYLTDELLNNACSEFDLIPHGRN